MKDESLTEIRELRKEFSEFKDLFHAENLCTRVEITKLRGNSKLWGAIGGAITTLSTGLVAVLIWLFGTK